MTVIAWKGGPVFRGGAVGTGTECCCGSTSILACTCSGSPTVVPGSVTAQILVNSRYTDFGSPPCTDADTRAYIQGTYSLPYLSYTSSEGLTAYATTLSSGRTIGFGWYCNTQAGGLTALFSVRFCSMSVTCWNRFYADFPFVVSTGCGVAPPLCSLTTGSTSTYTWTCDQVNAFQTYLANCGDPSLTPFAKYNMTIKITPVW